MKKEEFYFESRDNHSQIHAVRWMPTIENPRCIVQIVHGMAEYVERYQEFARFMTERGILVTGEDHLGHGGSMVSGKNPGYFCEQDAATVVVRDVHRLKKLTQEAYPGIPYILMGHSMGSFITRNYLCRYGSGIKGAVIMGTGMQPGALIMASKCLAAIQRLFFGGNHISHFIDKLAFGAYNQKIPNAKTEMDWLTREEEIVNAYLADPLCGFKFTVNGFATLFELINRLRKSENLQKIPRDLPVFFVSGKADPVGDYGKGVIAAYNSMTAVGMKHMELKLYEDDRHELLNETDRELVMQDIYQWIEKTLNGE